MNVLVINAGSSSIKYQLYEMPAGRVRAKGQVERIGDRHSKLTHQCGTETVTRQTSAPDHERAMQLILEMLVDRHVGAVGKLEEIAVVGHRVVHGGEQFTGSMVIDKRVLASIEGYVDLAPLHNPHNLVGINVARRTLPNSIQVACFDTAFHTSIPRVAHLYALPYELYERYGVRRYGFHGTSHRYVARRAAAIMGKDKHDLNAITCHLGNGCSITAVHGGRSVDTSMGFTPLEGLVMGTRAGDFDPAIIFYLAEKGYDLRALNTLCNKKSGLLGISGVSNDLRTIEGLVAEGHERARLALEVFCYRIRKYIGAYFTVLGRLDAIVFTGGIGEKSTRVRSLICEHLACIGVQFDVAANEATVGREACITAPISKVSVFVIPTNEEEAIARDAFELAADAGGS